MSVQRDALNLMHRLVASSEVQDMENADAFIVGAYDPELEDEAARGWTFVGRWTDPVKALAYAEKWQAELNSGNGPNDAPFSTKVFPMSEVE